MPFRRHDHRRWAALILLGASALAARAGADAIDVAVADGKSPVLARKLRAELAYAGFDTVDAAGEQTPAAIHILSPHTVQLSVQRASDATRFEQTLEQRPAEGESFALRVVEALRARLVDVGWEIPAASPVPVSSVGTEAADDVAPESPTSVEPLSRDAARPAVAAEAAPAGAEAPPGAEARPGVDDPEPSAALGLAPSGGLRLWLDAGAAGSWSGGGLGVTPHAALGIRLELGSPWAMLLRAHWPLREAEVEAPEGEARAAWSAYSAAIEHAIPMPGRWLASAGLGGGLFVLDAHGSGNGGYDGQHQRLLCGAGLVELSGGRALTGWLRVRATASAGVTAPRPVLRFDGREAASLGRAFGALGIALELGWPEPDPDPDALPAQHTSETISAELTP